jgi:hypothetical protein
MKASILKALRCYISTEIVCDDMLSKQMMTFTAANSSGCTCRYCLHVTRRLINSSTSIKMAKSVVSFLLVAVVVSAAVHAVAADQAMATRKLLAVTNSGCNRPPSGGFLFTVIITGNFWNHNSWLGNHQCCNGQWLNGGCHGGGCYWNGANYNNWSWENGWQCCFGSWNRGGCHSHKSDCFWEGKKFAPWSWWEGRQCCHHGSFKWGGCGDRN